MCLSLRNLHFMRGQHLFSTLFELPEAPVKNPGKGRSSDLDARRNELLLHRYYYYGKHSQKRYETILNDLSNEFFLSERRIQDIIQDNTLRLRELRREEMTAAELRRLWPHLVW